MTTSDKMRPPWEPGELKPGPPAFSEQFGPRLLPHERKSNLPARDFSYQLGGRKVEEVISTDVIDRNERLAVVLDHQKERCVHMQSGAQFRWLLRQAPYIEFASRFERCSSGFDVFGERLAYRVTGRVSLWRTSGMAAKRSSPSRDARRRSRIQISTSRRSQATHRLVR